MSLDRSQRSENSDAVLPETDATAAVGNAGLGGFLRAVFTPLASLRLTVVLLVLSVFVTFVATLQQARMDIWEVKRAHFPAFLTPVDFETLFPPAWFPEWNRVAEKPDGTSVGRAIPGRFYVPSGFALIVAMLVNLAAAHLLRMRIQASGVRLWAGLLVMLLGAAATWVVVFTGESSDGFRGNHSAGFYRVLWAGVQVLMLGLAVGLAFFAWNSTAARSAPRIAGWFGSAILFVAAAAVLYGGERAFIGDSAMRILWQLIQASLVAAVMLVGAQLVFRRKGGVVLVHLGIALLLVNEIQVTLTNVEQQMLLYEGQTSSQAVDIRSTEMFVADLRDPAKVTLLQIPGRRLERGERIDDPDLPFVVQCVDWHVNSELERIAADEPRRFTNGFGRDYRIVPRPPVPGTGDSEERNLAAAAVQLTDRSSGEVMGLWLLSELANDNEVRDKIEVQGVPWTIGMRLSHCYKPYSVNLIDTSSENYVGTAIPRTFESTVLLTDPGQGLQNARRNIWMNNPVRYRSETFYQSGYKKLPDGREYTVLQIVRNAGWMIPYVACMYVVVGLVGHFAALLFHFLGRADAALNTLQPPSFPGQGKPGYQELAKKLQGQTADSRLAHLAPENLGTGGPGSAWGARLAFWLTFGFAVLFVLGEVSRAVRPASDKAGQQKVLLDHFARIPMTYEGRLQPLESLARNAARMLGHRETVLKKDNQTRVPALTWLADTIFGAPGYGDYRIFRIEDPGVLAELGLDQGRKGFRYSLAELELARDRLERAIASAKSARGASEAEWSDTQKRLMDIQSKMGRLYAIKAAFGDPALMQGDFLQQTSIVKDIAASEGLPLVVPTGTADGLWIALNTAHGIDRIRARAEPTGAKDLNAAADQIADAELKPSDLKPRMIQDAMIAAVINDPQIVELMKKATGVSDVQSLRSEMERSFSKFPPKVYEMLLPQIEPAVDAEIARRMPEIRRDVRELVRGVYGKASPSVVPAWRQNCDSLLKLGAAWREQKYEEFDQLCQQHLAVVGTEVLGASRQRGVSSEILMNRLSPFYLATVLYLMAGIFSALSWAWASQRLALQRSASWVLWMGLAAQGIGLILRMVVTGRPPVTNLYSSFLFVSFGTLLLLQLVERYTREGIGTQLGAGFGATSLLWAYSSSIADGDTMIVLRAVLDTQFWLSTHVICISLGYAATAAAGLLGIYWVFCSLLRPRFAKHESRRLLDLIYGIVAFALLLSFFGTVLGGLWGDDSWGRFWGWDPKENGALMIVLWNAVLLHARWAGVVRDRGIAALAIFGIVVTLWSWECVNMLGVGLHAYSGTEASLISFELAGFSFDMNKRDVIFGAMGLLSACSLVGLLPRWMWRSEVVRTAG